MYIFNFIWHRIYITFSNIAKFGICRVYSVFYFFNFYGFITTFIILWLTTKCFELAVLNVFILKKSLFGGYNSIGRVSACDVEGYRFKSYYSPSIRNKPPYGYKNFKSVRVQLFYYFKKHPYFFLKFFTTNFLKKNLKNFFTFKNNFILFEIKKKIIVSYKADNKKIFLFLSFYRNKSVISSHNLSDTLSIGMVLASLNMFNCKFLRRATKGYRILLNFLNFPKSIFSKRLLDVGTFTVFFKNVNNRFFFLKKKIFKIFFKYNVYFFLINVGIPFSNLFGKKKKSIKKRLKKKIMSDFLKLI